MEAGYYEVSGKTGKNIDELFKSIIIELMERFP